MTNFKNIPKECSFSARGGSIAAKVWGDETKKPLLALHGWLDNAGSFSVLAPLLTDYQVVALDSPGHGLSSWKNIQASYNIWDDLLDILLVLEQLNWHEFSLLGHSRGGIHAFLLASMMPEKIKDCWLIDGILPDPFKVEQSPSQLKKNLLQQLSAKKKTFPSFDSFDDGLMAKMKVNQLSAEEALPIVERYLIKEGDLWTWRTDPRLLMASAFKLTEDHQEAFLSDLTVPTTLFIASEGMGAWLELKSRLQSSSVNIVDIEGHHHCHLTPNTAVFLANAIQGSES